MAAPSDTAPLPPRQLEAVRLAADDLGDREIARRMNVSLATVIDHLRRARRTAGVSCRAELIGWLKELEAATAAGKGGEGDS